MKNADIEKEGFDATTERLKEVEELLVLEIKKKNTEKNGELIEALLEEYDKLSKVVGTPMDKVGKEVEVSKYRQPIVKEEKRKSIWVWGLIFAAVISGVFVIALLTSAPEDISGPLTTEMWGIIFYRTWFYFPILLLIGAFLAYVWRQKHGKIIAIMIVIMGCLLLFGFAAKDSGAAFTIYLYCQNCKPGIPIYDNWSTTRKVTSYAQNGEKCIGTEMVFEQKIQVAQQEADYEFIDTESHLKVYCLSGSGWVYMKYAEAYSR